MTVVATQNNPVSEKQVRVDIDRGKQVFSAADLYKHGDARFKGDVLPNAGDRVFVEWFEEGHHMLVTSVNYKTLDWIFDKVRGDAWTLWTADLERDKQNQQSIVEEPTLEHDGNGNLVLTQVQTKSRGEDKGLSAKAKLAARVAARKTARMVRWCIAASISLTIICASLVVAYGYKTMEVGRDPFVRTCSVKLSNGTEVTGKREYVQKYHKIFGFKLIDTRQGYEKTTLDIRGVAMTVVGQYTKAKPVNPEDGSEPTAEERWWAAQMEAGDKERLVLRGADNYTFVAGKGAAVVKYEEFCKGM